MFNRPTLSDIVQRTRADTLPRLSQDEPLRFLDAEVLARVLAGASHELHGYLDWISKQILPDSSEAEFLDRHASIYLEEGRKAAQAASGSATVTGLVGSVITDGTIVRHADGREYAVQGEHMLAATSQPVPITAVTAGAAGNMPGATPLSFLSPVTGVQSGVVVTAAGLANGSDVESDSSLRARLLERLREPPNGGSLSDYRKWARAVPGVTRAWAYAAELGAGTVTVRFVRDDDASMIPDAAEVAAVDAFIQERKPVTAEVFVVAPLALAVPMTIQVFPDTASVRAAVEAELRDLFRREAEPGARLYLSHIREAISIAAGEQDHVLVSPTADIVPTTGQIPVLGAITWA